MKKLRILVDVDEVLNNLLDCWVDYLNKQYNANANAQDLKVWNLQGIFPELTEEEVNRPLYDDVLWQSLSPRPGSTEYLKRMIDDGHDVLIVTASVYQTLPAKMDWLFVHYPYLSWDNVILTRRKQLIRADVLIDDGIHNLEGGNYFKILFDCPNNRHYDAKKNGMIRVYSLKEAYEAINKHLPT
jgi:5'(3')-deoxyribonucleotidase